MSNASGYYAEGDNIQCELNGKTVKRYMVTNIITST